MNPCERARGCAVVTHYYTVWTRDRQGNEGAILPATRIVCWSARRIRIGVAAPLEQAVTSSGKDSVGVGGGCCSS